MENKEIDAAAIIPPFFLLNILSPGGIPWGKKFAQCRVTIEGKVINSILFLIATTFLEIGKYLSLQGLCAGKRREAAKEKKLFSQPPSPSDNHREMAGGRKTKSTSPALHNSVSLPRFEIPGKRQGNIFCTAT